MEFSDYGSLQKITVFCIRIRKYFKNRSALLNKMAARAKNRKNLLKQTSSRRPMAQIQNNFLEMFLGDPLPKLLKLFRSAEQNGRQSFNRHLLLGQWPDFKIISQKYSLGNPQSKLLKLSCSSEQNCRQS